MDLLYNKRGENSWLHFKVARIDNKFYAEFFTKNSMPFGNEIIEVNSITIDTLFKQSLIFSLQEGNSIEAREQYATDQIHILYNLLFATCKTITKIPVKHVSPKGDTLYTFVETINLNGSRKAINHFFNTTTKEVEHKVDSLNKLAVLKSFF
jgi:hypothetical protein